MSFTLHAFPSAKSAARQLAQAIAEDLRTTLATQERALLLVSGGRSPVTLFDALSSQTVAWHRIDLSLVDERSVALDADDANAVLVRRTLMAGPAREARWHPLMPAEVFASTSDPWQAAQRAAALANNDIALRQPAVIVLGLGTDGHTASLFPDAPQWADAATSTARYVCLQPGHAPYARVSLSLHALRMQKRCYMWAVGADKGATLTRLQQLPVLQQPQQNMLLQAGPVACLMADPLTTLDIFYSDDE